ncbi:uncharacterized protein PHALS_13449 [Plasmopara halstedii]|uniref:Uncharacterized protein n=1 Tax=Plasmopara halstedii TaxID=4781 RepID=A0A0P1AP01_PLAHL|nr:uncharacterized protein PHALS_13449 [Plasmopara halstedii]CEG43238.1 hypothetical protein PHALS_13449 [Plasmopara halstedii]|eukprot:XP_024579607.1 hypothetical protein PHALS_13449 [Plasmopara halstedii]
MNSAGASNVRRGEFRGKGGLPAARLNLSNSNYCKGSRFDTSWETQPISVCYMLRLPVPDAQ